MFSFSATRRKVSAVAITGTTDFVYRPRYRKSADFPLGRRYNLVNEENRFRALELIFEERLEGTVGRRQYRLLTSGKATSGAYHWAHASFPVNGSHTAIGPILSAEQMEEGRSRARGAVGEEQRIVSGDVFRVMPVGDLTTARGMAELYPAEEATLSSSSWSPSAAPAAAAAVEGPPLLPVTPSSTTIKTRGNESDASGVGYALKDKVVPLLKEHGIDWHDLKGLGRDELLDLCRLANLNASERVVFLAAIESKMCGVLTRSGKSRSPGTLCTRPGRVQHGWRCGLDGHVHHAYFEGKSLAPAALAATARGKGILSLSFQQRRRWLEAAVTGPVMPGSDAPADALNFRLLPNPSSASASAASSPLLPIGAPHSAEADTTMNARQLQSGHPHHHADGAAAQTTTSSMTSIAGGTSHHASSSSPSSSSSALLVEHRPMPNFSVVGRMQQRQVLHPRIWTAPPSPVFDVAMIGFEIRVHPCDPRASAQVENVHSQWSVHEEVVRSVVWEMLESYGVERAVQPLEMAPGELGEPDSVYAPTAAFWTSAEVASARAAEDPHDDGFSEGAAAHEHQQQPQQQNQQTIERRLVTPAGESRPWFTPPLPQDFSITTGHVVKQEKENVNDGDADVTKAEEASAHRPNVPKILPLAPSIIIRAEYRSVTEDLSPSLRTQSHQKLEHRLTYPLMDVSVLRHPDACFWWSPEDEEKAVETILSYARRVPFAVPFNLYIRVDPSRALQRQWAPSPLQPPPPSPPSPSQRPTNNNTSTGRDDSPFGREGQNPQEEHKEEQQGDKSFFSALYDERRRRIEAARALYFDLSDFRNAAVRAAPPAAVHDDADLAALAAAAEAAAAASAHIEEAEVVVEEEVKSNGESGESSKTKTNSASTTDTAAGTSHPSASSRSDSGKGSRAELEEITGLDLADFDDDS